MCKLLIAWWAHLKWTANPLGVLHTLLTAFFSSPHSCSAYLMNICALDISSAGMPTRQGLRLSAQASYAALHEHYTTTMSSELRSGNIPTALSQLSPCNLHFVLYHRPMQAMPGNQEALRVLPPKCCYQCTSRTPEQTKILRFAKSGLLTSRF